MDDFGNTAVLCPLGHGLFLVSARSPQRQCPSCGVPLVDVDDEISTCSFRFVPQTQPEAIALALASESTAVMGIA